MRDWKMTSDNMYNRMLKNEKPCELIDAFVEFVIRTKATEERILQQQIRIQFNYFS